MRRIHTVALALSATIAFFVGGWAFFAPRSFFDSFPGVLGQWVATDGPFNEHLVRDVGAFYLGLGVASVAGLVWRSPVVFRILGLAWTTFGVLHLWYHATHLDHLQADAAVGTVVSLSISLALGVVLLVPGPRAGGGDNTSRADVASPTDATGSALRAGGVGSATSARTTTEGETR
ncbi:hypothetical protein ACFQ58_04905 [Agromyces sp. NPDC056523]|uniref:hypothetical protein n=1 Tax=Agromyces sp. NPDC056523 TaxID=3345850 RepID=UPI00366C21B7